MRRFALAPCALALLVALTACGGDSDEPGEDTTEETGVQTEEVKSTEEVEGETADDILFWLRDDAEWRIRTVPFGGLTG